MNEKKLTDALAELLERYKPFAGHALLDAKPETYEATLRQINDAEPRFREGIMLAILSAVVLPDVLRVLPESSWAWQVARAVQDQLVEDAETRRALWQARRG